MTKQQRTKHQPGTTKYDQPEEGYMSPYSGGFGGFGSGLGGLGGVFGDVGRYTDGLLQNLTGRNPDLMDAADEVAADQAARILLTSRHRELTQDLLSYVRNEAVTPYRSATLQHGLWLLATLPEVAADQETLVEENAGGLIHMDDPAEQLLERLSEFPPDIVLYLVYAGEAWCANDSAWVSRLRALGAPLLPVVIGADMDSQATDDRAAVEAASGEQAAMARKVQQLIGVKPAFIGGEPSVAATEGAPPPADVVALLQRIVALRPRVAIALAQDVAWCRPLLARRIVRSGALLTALVSAQPVPLLDLPLQVALQWKVAMQLAAIYGRPGLDNRSREMMGTIAWNLLIRFVMQQLARFVPMLGWLISAGIGWISTTLLGHALVTIYENEDCFNLEEQGRRVIARAGVAVAPVRTAATWAADAVRVQAVRTVATMQAVWPRHRSDSEVAAAPADEQTAEPSTAGAMPASVDADDSIRLLPAVNLETGCTNGRHFW